MKTVIIAGGTGLVGLELSKLLVKNSYQVVVLSRSGSCKVDGVVAEKWDPAKNELNPAIFNDGCVVINLAGANIGAGRWTKSRKELIINSRTESNQCLKAALGKSGIRLSLLISASATGYYGAITDAGQCFKEEDKPANDFLGHTCELWEESSIDLAHYADRHAIMRFGVVLSQQGGALPKMAKPVKLLFGNPVASSKQIVPWIHISDLCNWLIYTIENSHVMGVYNTVAPDQVNNANFTKCLSEAVHRPYIPLPIPQILLKIIFGEMSDLICEGSRVSSDKISNSGFEMFFSDLPSALADLYPD